MFHIGNRAVTQFSRLVTFYNRGNSNFAILANIITSSWRDIFPKIWLSLAPINLCILPIANYVAKYWMYITLQGLFFTTILIFEVTYLRRRKKFSKCPGLRKIWSVCANVMFTTDGGVPQAQVCDICHRYGRRKIIKRWHFQLWNWQIFATFCVRRTFQQQNYMLQHQVWF